MAKRRPNQQARPGTALQARQKAYEGGRGTRKPGSQNKRKSYPH